MKPLLPAVLALALAGPVAAQPPSPAPTQCIGRVALPPTLARDEVRTLVAPGRLERRVIPGHVSQVWRRVLVRPARTQRVRVPALYRLERSSVLAPGPMRWVREPAHYELRSERVVVAPGHWRWTRRDGTLASAAPPRPDQTVVEPTGLVMCKVWQPARYAEIDRRVLVAPPRAYRVATTVRRWSTRRVLVRPARVVQRRIGAEYRYVPGARTVHPARTEWVRTPPRRAVAARTRLVSGGEGWAPVVCSGPLSVEAMARMQAALNARGYDAGPADGQDRPQSFSALRRFQADHRMAAGQITLESARALGVTP